MFKQLRDHSHFIDYLERLESWICDIRNGDYSEETRKMTSKIIKNNLLDKLKLQNERKGNFLGNIGE